MDRLQTSLRYLHHDGHPQRVFSDVFFAFLARRAAAFGIFRLVKLVLLRVRHTSSKLLLINATDFRSELSPDDEEQQQSTHKQRSGTRVPARHHRETA